MRKIFIAAILTVPCIPAQPFDNLLLPQTQHIAGAVVDSNGKPVVEARIDHTNDRQSHETDSEGKFELETQSPVLVIRKPGFQSGLARTKDATEVRVTLRKLSEDRVFPTCSSTGRYVGIEGWGSSFRFPEISDMKASPQVVETDVGARTYYVDTKQGPKGIYHCNGGMCGPGTPSNRNVWQSVTYEEVTFETGGQTIIDAHGQLTNGMHWRFLGKFGESASYFVIDETTAETLDRFLDGVCLKPASRQ